MPLTLVMLTIAPPSGWLCMTALACCANSSGATRFSVMMAVENLGEAVAGTEGGGEAGPGPGTPAGDDHDLPRHVQRIGHRAKLPTRSDAPSETEGRRGDH